jgi:hypothetical protein
MSEQFKLGEVVIGQNFIYATHRNGDECIIIEPLRLHDAIGKYTRVISREALYKVRWSDGEEICVAPVCLRRRQPPTTGEHTIMALFLTTPKAKEREHA